jgi:hypothetical protein
MKNKNKKAWGYETPKEELVYKTLRQRSANQEETEKEKDI